MYPLESVHISRQSNSAKSCKYKETVAATEPHLLVAILSSLLHLFLDAEQKCSFPSWPFFHVEFLHFPNHEVSLSCREWNLVSEVMKTCLEFLCLCGFVLGFFSLILGFLC